MVRHQSSPIYSGAVWRSDGPLRRPGMAETRTARQPGEERQVDVPLDASKRAAPLRISCSSGFRPSEHDANSRDTRFLAPAIRPLRLIDVLTDLGRGFTLHR